MSNESKCPGHNRDECVSCCWPKVEEEMSSIELCQRLVDQVLSVAPENYAGHTFGVTGPDGSQLGDIIITVVKPDGKGPHELRMEAETKLSELQATSGYTAVDMTTAAAQGFRDGAASIVIDMAGRDFNSPADLIQAITESGASLKK